MNKELKYFLIELIKKLGYDNSWKVKIDSDDNVLFVENKTEMRYIFSFPSYKPLEIPKYFDIDDFLSKYGGQIIGGLSIRTMVKLPKDRIELEIERIINERLS